MNRSAAEPRRGEGRKIEEIILESKRGRGGDGGDDGGVSLNFGEVN